MTNYLEFGNLQATEMEPGKSKIKVLPDSVSDKGLLFALHKLHLHLAKGQKKLISSFMSLL
jgi:hypothetical protein